MKNRFCFVLIVCCLLLCTSCSSFKFSPETEAYRDEYLEAVEKAENAASGEITVSSLLVDEAIEFKTTESRIDFKYTVENKKVLFEREDYLDGELSAKYKSDGKIVESFDLSSEKWVDKTEENAVFLSADKNPLTTLSLFRVDNNNKVKTSYLSDVKKRTEGEYSVIEFVLNDKSVSTVLGYTKADGIVRNSAGHVRSYYINSDGELCRIVIKALQDVINNGKQGKYDSTMTVEIKR